MSQTSSRNPLPAGSVLAEPCDIPIATQGSQSQTPNHRLKGLQPYPCFSVNLGRIDYKEAWQVQSGLVAAKIGRSSSPDIVLILEHPAVFTLGRRGGRDHLLVSDSFLKQSGIPIVQVERGGYITFHGPGQLVVYFIINLEARRLGVTDFVTALEEIMLRTVSTWGLAAQRNKKNRGIWMGDSKIGSIGIALRKGVSFHGLALNVNLDLIPFSWIRPCGLPGVSMTSVKQELGREVPMETVCKVVKENLKSVIRIYSSRSFPV